MNTVMQLLKKTCRKNTLNHQYSVLVKPSLWKSALLLLLSIMLMIFAVVLRVLTSSDEEKLVQLQKEVHETAVVDSTNENFRDVKTIDSIGNFERQVHPVSFEDIVLEKRSQHFEFKDAEYVVARKAAWTVQVMDVAEEDVILDFLSTAEKRDQFAYFRYIAGDKAKRYILIFDDFNDEEGAQEAIVDNEFELPKSIKPFARSFKDYVGTVDSYHLQRNVKDYKRNKYREVVLRKARAPVYHDSGSSIPVTRTNRPIRKPQSTRKKSVSAFNTETSSRERVVQPDVNLNDKNLIKDEKAVNGSSGFASKRNLDVQKSDGNKPAIKAPKQTVQQPDNISSLIDTIEQ